MKKFNNILKLLTWNNQSFPIGSYSFSSGLEYAVETKIVFSSYQLLNWLKDLLTYGSLQSDSILLAETWKLKKKKQCNKILELNQFAVSLNQSHEKYIENYEQGRAFIKVAQDAWGHNFINKHLIFPIAYACSAAQENISLDDSLQSFIHSNLGNLLAAGIKLIPLGQTDGQKIQVELNKHIDKEYRCIKKRNLNSIGSCAWANDIISMRHENQYTRIFRT